MSKIILEKFKKSPNIMQISAEKAAKININNLFQ